MTESLLNLETTTELGHEFAEVGMLLRRPQTGQTYVNLLDQAQRAVARLNALVEEFVIPELTRQHLGHEPAKEPEGGLFDGDSAQP